MASWTTLGWSKRCRSASDRSIGSPRNGLDPARAAEAHDRILEFLEDGALLTGASAMVVQRPVRRVSARVGLDDAAVELSIRDARCNSMLRRRDPLVSSS
jgi:hypothetical protein